ncbi:MAG: repeat variant [Bacteroidetes bacterium]|jgi:antitoxin component YwqK of YwqJK toxin-antitoxin module|nr:repeat variant [Bacteroidota bacterium]
MKTLIFLFITALSLSVQAQQLNEKGLYVDSDNGLFSGIITANNNGIRSEIQVKNGQINGEAIYYYASGNVMEKGNFADGKKDQKWIRFNENGTTAAVAFYNLGKKTGTWLVYDDKGNKRFEMNYTDGEKSGIWTIWDENGVVQNTKNYNPN